MFTKLREPQQKAFDAILAAWERNPGPTLAEMATGVGKTPLAGAVAKHRASLGRTMMIAHRKELVKQGAAKIKEVTGDGPAIEMGDYQAYNDLWGQRRNVVVASTQSLLAKKQGLPRLERYNPFEFATLIIDECHHYPKNKGQWHTIATHFMKNPNLRVLGLTATADRADKKALGTLFKTVAYQYGIKQAIDDGWLVPVDIYSGTLTELNLSNVHEVAGDLNAGELAQVMEVDANLFGVAEHILRRCGDRKTLVFCASVEHARLLTAILNDRKALIANYVCDKTSSDDRDAIFSGFLSRQFQFLCNFGIATEGFDDPGIEVVVIARPTKSRSLYAQMIGRGTRVLGGLVDQWEFADDRRVAIGESSKPCVEVIEFAGNAGKHKLISALDILGGDYEEDVIANAKKIITDKEACPVADALKLSQMQLWEEEKQREKDREYERLAKAKVSSHVTYERVNPFDLTVSAAERRENWNNPRPIPEKMMIQLERHAPRDVDLKNIDIRQAAKLHAEIMDRFKRKLCTVRMARTLEKRGLPSEIPMELAGKWIDRLAKNKWKVPNDLKKEAEAYKRPPKYK